MLLSMAGDSPPRPTDDEALALVREAATKGLVVSSQARRDLDDEDYNHEDVENLVKCCEDKHLNKHELDKKFPLWNYWVVVLKMTIPDKKGPYYIKVGLKLPTMLEGRLISFHPWGQHDRANQ
jgi:hypothetical protein